MKKTLKKLALALLAVLIIIQFFRPAKNNSTLPGVSSNDISKVWPVTDDVHKILQTSCYDCHSNNTKYPWYINVQPVAWWMNDHILEGKKEINFSEFASYRIGRQYKKMEEIIEQVKDDEMPLYSYTIIHRNAILNKDQKLSLTNWANAIRDSIKANYPADSLKRR
ncbi:MAG: heme-binding domain-containing protein [Ferruginibacter sp.]